MPRRRSARRKDARRPRRLPSPPAPVDPGLEPTSRAYPQLQLLLDKQLLERGYSFDAATADEACRFIESFCRHSKAPFAGQPFTLAPWQRGIVRRFFGWKRPNGQRRYTKLHVWVPRKNGKSTWFAAMSLFLGFAEGVHGAETYCLASAERQARFVFDEARRMVDASPELRGLLAVYASSIFMASTLSKMEVLAGKGSSQHGTNPTAVIIDELHAIKNREIYDVATSGSITREQPAELVISTAGFDRFSLAWELWDYAKKVEEGIYEDPEFLGVIYAADPEDDWHDEATWYKANPNLGISISLEKFREKYIEATRSPGAENRFKNLHLNLWTEQAVRWLQISVWDRCADLVTPADLVGRECYGGLDLSNKIDLSAFVRVFPREDLDGEVPDGRPRLTTSYDVLCNFWVPAEGAARRAKKDRVPYPKWIEEGLITATDGDVIDYDVIYRDILAAAAATPIIELAYDRTFAYELVPRLQEDGITMVPVAQGPYSLSEATKMLEALVVSRRLRHGGHKVLRWNASNVAVRKDSNGNYAPDKRKSTERIDGVSALVNALSRAILRVKTMSVYEDRGIISLP